MKYLISILFLLATLTQPSLAQQHPTLADDWKGTISLPNQKLIIKLHFEKADAGYSGNIDIPQQSGHGLKLKKIKQTDRDSVSWMQNTGGNGTAKFKGHFKTDSVISGTFHQRGYQFPFKVSRYTPKVVNQKSLPYHHKDVIIKNDSIKIGGTLTGPENGKANQLVIMTTGSGAQNRDEEIFGFKIFGQIADYLTRHGITTFRYDDRGVGKSTGDLGDATLKMLASDVKSVVAHFSDSSNHYFNTITLLGHSGGGEIDGMAAAKDTLVDKLILMSSPGISLKKVLHYQVKPGFLSAGVADSTAEDEIVARENLMEAIRKNKDIEKAQEDYKTKFEDIQITAGADSVQALKLAKRQAKTLLKAYSTPKMQSQLFYDPTSDVEKLNIPVLATFGGKDTQVLVSKNLPPIRKALDSAKVSYQINIFRNANHLYQKAKTGSVKEYSTLKKHVVKGFLPTIEAWLNRTSRAQQ